MPHEVLGRGAAGTEDRLGTQEFLDRVVDELGMLADFPLEFGLQRHAPVHLTDGRRDRIETARLDPGLHLLTNLDVNDFECPKISRAYDQFAALAHAQEFAADPLGQHARLRELLADHATQLDARTPAPNAICLHLDGYGTRSSSLIFLGADGRPAAHLFAPGPPCITGYERAPLPDDE